VCYARVGKPYCVECGRKIEKLSTEEILNFIKEKIQKFQKEKKGKKKLMGVEWNKHRYKFCASCSWTKR
jgi:excinuclease UvrABC ATPase subunit